MSEGRTILHRLRKGAASVSGLSDSELAVLIRYSAPRRRRSQIAAAAVAEAVLRFLRTTTNA